MPEPSPLEIAAAIEAARRAGWRQDEITLAGWITARTEGRARPETLMPESPDFDRIARDHVPGAPSDPLWSVNVQAIAEQLRLVWNARGAADIAKIEAELSGPYVKNLDHALRTLDR